MQPNSEQQAVIDELKSNIILFAGAGTGKTFTVARRVDNIIRKNLAKPEEILCLTFTIKACDEMKSDVLRYSDGAERVKIKTIHSFCYDVIREESKLTGSGLIDPEVYDDADEEEFLAKFIPETLTKLHLDAYLRDCGLKGLESLYNKDVVNILTKSRSNNFFWRLYSGGEPMLLNSYLCCYPEKQQAFYENENFKCPECGEVQTAKTNECLACGYDFRTYIKPYKFNLTKFRSLVSEIKRHREIYMYYSVSEEADYQKTYLRLLGENKIDPLVKCRLENNEYGVDGDFLIKFYPFAGKIVAGYNSYLRESNKVDFDDLIVGASVLLRDCAVQNRWRSKYKYITVDEMQDTSILEYNLLKKVFEGNNVMMCGDYFQTIYEWRGSHPEDVLGNFIETFNAKKVMFSENYRSTRTLTRAAFGYVKNTFPPELVDVFLPAELKINSMEEGEKIEHRQFKAAIDEAVFIYNYILRHPLLKPNDVCIMSRSNKYISKLYLLLTNYGRSLPKDKRLNFFTVEEEYRFYKKPVVKDILAVYSLLLNKFSYSDIERLAQRYLKGVGEGTLSAIRNANACGASVAAFLEEDSYISGDWLKKLVDNFETDNVVVYDTETTGLETDRDEIVQIAAIKIDRNGKITDKFEKFVIPDREISEGALRTHGYDLEHIKACGGVKANEALREFSTFINGCVLVGHNSVKFDRPLIDRQLSENNLAPLEIIAEYDTLILAKLLLADSPDYKLETLCKRFGVVNERAHDAFGDISATAQVLTFLIKESIVPNSEQRIKIIGKYAARFKPFYDRYATMLAFYGKNMLTELNDYILDNFDIFKVHKNASDAAAVEELFENVLVESENHKSLSACLQSFLLRCSLAGSQMDVLINKLNKIPIITVHQTKGCEFDTVIIAGTDNGNFPSFAAVKSGNGEEEKRVFYVAISRAKSKLVLTNCYDDRYKTHSPFINKIPREYIDG